MKKSLLFVFSMLFCVSAKAQYTALPWNGTGSVSGCPSSDGNCNGTVYGATVQLLGVFSGSNFRIAIAKCSGGTFTTSGTFFLKKGGVCGQLIEQVAVIEGTNYSYIDVPLSDITSTTSFYGIYQATGGARYHTLGITLYPPPELPDLSLNNVSLNLTSVEAGSNITMTHTVSNSGLGNAGPFRISYYLSTNPSLSSDDENIGNADYNSGIDAESQYAGMTKVLNIPSTTTARLYYIIAFIDSEDGVSESSESNNKTFSSVTITDPPNEPDLSIEINSLSSTSVQKGSTVTANFSFYNSGGAAGAFSNQFVLSTNPTYSPNDIILDTFSVGSYAGNSSSTGLARILTIPGTVTPGSYYIVAYADYLNEVAESSESNNEDFSFITITDAQSITVTSPTSGSFIYGQTMQINWTSTGPVGTDISIQLVNASTNEIISTLVDPTTNDGNYAWLIPNTITAGTYKIKVFKTTGGVSNFSGSFTIGADPNCPNCITGQTVANFTVTGNAGFCAAQYLCANNIIIPAQPNPTNNISRGDLANITYRGLIGQNTNTNAINFPCPFIDLQINNAGTAEYYKHAKTLSYLEYGDSRSPFNRDNVSFSPSDPITKALVLKVLLESWNIDESTVSGASPYTDVTTAHPYYKYIKKAHELGIVVGSGINFLPDGNCSREQAFLMLYRIIISASITKPTLAQINAGFFIPGQYRPDNMNIGAGTDRGNFNHYTKTSFALDGIVPLVFAHAYNSYTTELPNKLYPNYLGRGWTHSFNCYITSIGSDSNARLVVHYPDGRLHYYKIQGAVFVPESIGVFDVVTTAGNPITSVTITTSAKVVYNFEKLASQTGNYWLIKTIKDRNNNTLTFINEIGINGVPRVASVSDQAGRSLKFTYLTNQAYNYLSQVTLAGVGAFNGRNIQFTYSSAPWDGDGIKDLTGYKEYDLTGALKTTSYAYYNTEGSEHLLKTITLPKGNVINNTYEKRKLKSSQTLNGATVVQQMNTNWTPTYTTNAQSSTGSVSVTAGGVTKTTNYTHNSNGLAQGINSTGTNPVNLTMNYGLNTDPTAVTKITQNHGGSSTGVRIKYYNTSPHNVEYVKTAKAAGDSITQSYVYNAFNDISNFTNGRGFTTTFAYNGTGNLTQINHPIGQPTLMLRNSNGTISKVTTPAGIVTNFTYNTYGNLLTTSTPNGANPAIITSATYDALSRVLSKTDARNQTVNYEYFANDLLKKMNAPLSYYVSYNYDANDNNTSVTNAKGNVTTNVYHTQTDQLMSRSFGSKTESFTYYEDGSLKTFTNGRNQVFSFTYDQSGRITDDSYSTYTYNPEGTLNTITHIQGAKTYTLDYNYDLLRRLNKTTCDGFAVQYRYDNNNNLDLLTYPDGKTVSYTYDKKDRIVSITDWAGRVTSYVYDDDGKTLSYTMPNGSKVIYSYDAAGRPTGMSHRKSSNAVICSSSFVLDQGGNHLEENIIEPYTASPTLTASTTNYTNNARNETTQAGSNNYAFDGNGATTNQAGQALTWDTKDNLLTAYGKTFYYDGNETRRAKTGKRFVINELSNSILAETDEAGNYLYYYVYGPTGLLYRQSASGTIEYYHYDFRGSTIAMTDASQNIVRQYQYDAYGKILQQSPAIASDNNPFRYVGQFGVQYEEPNLYFMRARYYDPGTGKFLSEDPIWSTNLFAYGGNNPITMIDFDGKQEAEVESFWKITFQDFVSSDIIVEYKGESTSIANFNPGGTIVDIVKQKVINNTALFLVSWAAIDSEPEREKALLEFTEDALNFIDETFNHFDVKKEATMKIMSDLDLVRYGLMEKYGFPTHRPITYEQNEIAYNNSISILRNIFAEIFKVITDTNYSRYKP